MTKLIFISERFASRVYELAQEHTTVGRGDQNTLALHDSSVSLAHADILMNGPEIIVRDLGSANGTFVNGAQVDHQCQIKSGQTVRFGAVEARLELDLPGWEDTPSEESAVFAARRFERRQKLEDEMPKTSTAPVVLESDTLSGPTDQTVLLPPQARGVLITPPPQAPQSAREARPRIMRRVVIAAAVAAGIAIALWMIFIRK